MSSSAVRGSGDVNQGREMEVLARELHAFDASVLSFHCVAEHVAPSYPERVRRVLKPLPVEGRNLGAPKAFDVVR